MTPLVTDRGIQLEEAPSGLVGSLVEVLHENDLDG
jgi:hypothetical protein